MRKASTLQLALRGQSTQPARPAAALRSRLAWSLAAAGVLGLVPAVLPGAVALAQPNSKSKGPGSRAPKSDPAKPDAKPDAAAPESTGGGSQAVGTVTTVTLLEPGAEPRAALRYKLAPGARYTVTQTRQGVSRVAASLAAGSAIRQEGPEYIPRTVLTLEIVIREVRPSGDYAFDITITDARAEDDGNAPPSAVRIATGELQLLKGLAGRGVINDRGMLSQVEFTLPADAKQVLRDVFRDTAILPTESVMTLPAEPVGAGAVWQVDSEVSAPRLRYLVSSRLTLQSFDAEAGVAKVVSETEQSAGNQPMLGRIPGLVNGATVQIRSMLLTGAGDTTASLSSPFATTASQRLDGDVVLIVTPPPPSQGVRIDQNLRLRSTSSSQPAAPK